MDFIAGAKILAERIGSAGPRAKAQVPPDARPLFHWCGVDPNPTEGRNRGDLDAEPDDPAMSLGGPGL